MKKTGIYLNLIILTLAGCETKESKITLPDLSPSFNTQLMKRDSTLSLDSFYFVRADTFSQKKVLIHERFPLLHILNRINDQISMVYKGIDTIHAKPSANDLEKISYLNGEKIYLDKQIDSLNRLIIVADSILPVGYRLIYKVTVRKDSQFSVSDTISYSLDKNMRISDWDRNIDKDIDSLSIGRHIRPLDMQK